MRTSTKSAAAIALLMMGLAAHAQTLRDPTRPPGAAAARGAPMAEGGLVLQSILLSPQRKAAVISGKVIGPGESVDGYMLVGISEGEAVLKNGDKIRRLRLYPAVDMKHQREPQGGSEAAPAAPTGSQ
jgi:MSHA biogenesis protein MshK